MVSNDGATSKGENVAVAPSEPVATIVYAVALAGTALSVIYLARI